MCCSCAAVMDCSGAEGEECGVRDLLLEDVDVGGERDQSGTGGRRGGS